MVCLYSVDYHVLIAQFLDTLYNTEERRLRPIHKSN